MGGMGDMFDIGGGKGAAQAPQGKQGLLIPDGECVRITYMCVCLSVCLCVYIYMEQGLLGPDGE